MSKIIEHTSNGFKWLLVEVPEHIPEFKTSIQPDKIPCISYFFGDNIDPTIISLPSGSWEIAGKADSLTEGQWRDIVEINKGSFATPTMLGYKFLKAFALKPSTTLILKSTAI